MTKVDVRITPCPEHVCLELRVDGATVAQAQLEAPDLDMLIRQLADARSVLADVVPKQLEPNAKVEAVRDPCWRVSMPIEGGLRPLLLRHPGLGWVGYALPEESAAEMGRWLTATTEAGSGVGSREAAPARPIWRDQKQVARPRTRKPSKPTARASAERED